MGNRSPSDEQLELMRMLHEKGGVVPVPTHFRYTTVQVLIRKGWAEPKGAAGLQLTERGRRLVVPA